ncbi:MAG: c-type cytochrome, partial [Planctomycetia bacterium]|nr:c-type cytochrome [Planctomycetia bacterium]
HDRDDALDYSIWLTARELRDAWLPAVLAGTFDDGGKISRLAFAIEAADAHEAMPQFAVRWQQQPPPAAERAAALRCIARLGNADQLRIVFDVAVNPGTSAADATALLEHMLEGHRRRRTVPAGDISAIAGLVGSADGPLATRAIEAVAAWQLAAAAESLVAAANDAGRSLDLRRTAITALGSMPGDAPRTGLVALAKAEGDDAVRAAAIAALVPQSLDIAAAHAVPFLKTTADTAARDAVFRSFLLSKDGAAALAKAIDQAAVALAAEAVRAGMQAISSAGRAEPALAKALEAAGAHSGATPAPASPHAMNDAQLDAFVELVRTKGDRSRGEAIYKRESLKCVSCHRIGDDGGRVGPNLAAIGASSQLDYIIDSLVQPAKNVKEGYNTLVVVTDDGQVVTGIQVSRSDEELVLRDATGKEVKVSTADIDEETSGTSLMPAGLVDPLSREELADLVRYLSELGR